MIKFKFFRFLFSVFTENSSVSWVNKRVKSNWNVSQREKVGEKAWFNRKKGWPINESFWICGINRFFPKFSQSFTLTNIEVIIGAQYLIENKANFKKTSNFLLNCHEILEKIALNYIVLIILKEVNFW